MPGALHELVVDIFRRAPEMLVRFVASLGVNVPAHDSIQVESGDLGQLVPIDRRADLVVLLLRGAPVLVCILEVQLNVDPDKRYVWPAYVSVARDRHRCPVALLVYAPRRTVAAWAKEAVVDLNFSFTPLVLGPDAVPWVRDREAALSDPPAAFFSAIAHGDDPGADDVILNALASIAVLDDTERANLSDALLASLSAARRAHIEAIMSSSTYQLQTDFAKRYAAKGFEKGLEQGREEGLEAAVLTVLRVRRIPVDDAARTRIETCQDAATLQRWLERAATATTVAQIFEDAP